MADAATLLEYGICNKDQIDLEVRAVVTYVIQIQLNKDSKLPVEVTPATKIRYIKEWIHEQTSITVEKQILRHGENLLNDDKRMAECQIGEGEIIRLEICHTGSFPVFIVNHTGVWLYSLLFDWFYVYFLRCEVSGGGRIQRLNRNTEATSLQQNTRPR